MILHEEQQKAETIERVAQRAEAVTLTSPALLSQAGRGGSTDVGRFVRQLYANVPPEAMLEESEENLAGAALSFWRFAAERRPGSPKIRVVGPGAPPAPADTVGDGWASPHTVVEIVNDDMPFLVDSVTAELVHRGAEIFLVIHPVVRVERDAHGRLLSLAVSDAGASGSDESFMHLRVGALPPERWGEACEGLERVLADVRAAVLDWPAMRDRCQEVTAELRTAPPPLPSSEVAEGIAFLDWLRDHSFTFLGYREYGFEGSGETGLARVVPASGLGVLREERVVAFEELRNVAALPAEIRAFIERPELLLVTKTKMLSNVHRRVPMDAVVVKSFDAAGKVTGQAVFAGLFTSAAYLQSVHEIPFLRQKVRRAMERSGFSPASHDGKNLLSVLEVFPRDELFQTGEDDLFRVAKGVLYLLHRPRVAAFVRPDPFGRFVSCLILVPAERFDAELKDRFEEVLAAAYGGRATLRHSQLRDGTLAWLLFNVETPAGAPALDEETLGARLAAAARTWEDQLEELLLAERGEVAGSVAVRRFGRAFPAGYRERFTPQEAAFDVERLERATASGDLAFQLYRPSDAAASAIRFKIFGAGPRVALSDLLPMLENMGFRVLDENLYTVTLAGGPPAWIRDFNMTVAEAAGDPLELSAPFEEAFGLVWRGGLENDGFNRLVLLAALSAREVTVLRAYCKFLRQAKAPFSQTYMEEALARHGDVARLLAELFAARFDPEHRVGADERAARALAELEVLLAAVANLDDLRILRRFVNLIESTLRTNFYQLDAQGHAKGYISFKLDSQRIDGLPLPRPLVEIFVYSPAVEAVHLRGGKVARGGIRWSDRREDFRTEVLDLMKAQMVKNAVIVPVGSKGGFVVKRQVPRDKLQAEGVECYQTMMHGLLDVTDNLAGDALVPPPRVVRRDGDDPYLVVAADKGTARFSDLANSISQAHGFWLDDAFASGGSAGYDHKAMAITSRGTWESVKRHFRELGKDVQNEDFTVVGVGDMSGDVFGNGMLRSAHIRLVAAFDHRHVFLDPDPDAAISFAERKRLFELPTSSWADYDRALLSPGGGVWERGARSIPVSPQMAARFGLTGSEIAPAELMQALLKAPVELLFFGGIGTFVKAKTESHGDAKDRANDPIRVDGGELRAKVVAEGANLGLTQRGRIEYALAGGHLNTDFIDNSAGVDCSDHEVNIKILLGDVERSGGLTREARNALLKEMTDEVATLVLRDNYLQTQALSVTRSVGGHHLLDRLARVMRGLERDGRLDRRIEFLPDDDELRERAQQRTGFTRPELAVLFSYAKIALYDEILRSDLPDDPFMQEDLRLYFPSPLRGRFAKEIGRHRLRREIISTSVTNSMVNRAGIAFVREAKEKTGEEAADVARAYVVTREVFGLRRLWQEIESLDNQVPASAQAAMLVECGRLLDRATTWFLRAGGRPLDIGFHSQAYAGPIGEIGAHLDELLPAAEAKQLADKAGRFVAQGVPESLARTVAALAPWLAPALDAVRIAREKGLDSLKVARLYFVAGERFGFGRLREAAAKLPTDKAWDKLAVSAVIDDLYSYQSAATARVLATSGDGIPAEAAVEAWAEKRRPVLARAEELMAELKTTETPELAMLAVANQQLKALGA